MTAYFVLFIFTWLAAHMKHDNVLRYVLFFVPTVLIVGFRLEMGFDWPVYKEQFIEFSSINIFDFFSQFPAIMLAYPHEPLFLTTSYLASQIFPAYEYMQVSVYLLFVYSVFKLGKVIGVQNIIASFIPIHLFLLFTLEFSTIRQAIAISLFNIGLAFYLQNKKTNYIWYYMSAVFMQSSALLYIFAKYLSISTTKRTKLAIIFGIILVVFVSGGGLKLLPISILPEFIQSKLNYYIFERKVGYSSIELGIFLVNISVIVFILINARKKMDKQIYFISRLVIILCFIAVLIFWVTVMRNRIMYEIIILVSLLIYGPTFPYQKLLRYVFISIGALLLSFSLIKKASFVYLPYQNYIWFQVNDYESDGYDRLDRLYELIYRNKK